MWNNWDVSGRKLMIRLVKEGIKVEVGWGCLEGDWISMVRNSPRKSTRVKALSPRMPM